MQGNFASLHVHSQFSPLDSVASADEYVKRAVEVGITSIALTDHGKLGGHRELQRACQGTDIKPILGVETYYSPTDRFDRRTKANRQDGTSIYDHLILLAMNENGLRNLNKINAEAWQTGFYNKPRIDKELLELYGEDIIVSSACMSGPIAKPFREGNDHFAYERAEWFKDRFGDRFYIEIMTENDAELNTKLLTLADDLQIKPILTEDCHYVWPQDLWIEQAMLVIATSPKRIPGASIDQVKNASIMEKFNHLYGKDRQMSFEDLSVYMAGREFREKQLANQGIFRDDLFENTLEIADQIEEYPYFKGLSLLPSIDSPQEKLERMAWAGFKKRGLSGKIAEDRIKYELSVIRDKDFSIYFVIVNDILAWCREQGIRTGFGRGSSSNYLLCYCLGITEVDSLKYDLVPERFLDPDRPDWPDVDMDVQDDRRDEVKAFIEKKYGHVASISTLVYYQAKNGLKDAATALGISFSEANAAIKDLDPKLAFDQYLFNDSSRAFHKKYPDVLTIAQKLQGKLKNTGMHPGGIVISREPLENVAPIETAAVKGKDIRQPLIAYDMNEAEEIGLIKMDLLGLRDLAVIDDCLALLKKKGIDIDVMKIPLDDADTFKMLADGFTKGIFQAQGSAFHRWIMETGVTCFEDLIIGTSIARPGPMNTVGPIYKRRLRKEEAVSYVHPVMEQYLKGTLGVIIFQESVLQLLTNLAGFSMKEANQARRIIAKKKDPALLQVFKQKFMDGLAENGVRGKNAIKLWSDIEAHTGYSFGRGHAVAYSLLTNAMAYLKCHHPQEFILALLQHEKEDMAITDYLIEAKRMGINILMPHVNKSEKNFSIEGDAIRIGLTNVKFIAEKNVAPIIQNRPFKSYADIKTLMAKKGGINSRVVSSLLKVNAIPFDDTPKDPNWRDNLYEYLKIPQANTILPPKIASQMIVSSDYEESVPCLFSGMVRNVKNGPNWTLIEMLDAEGTLSFFTEPGIEMVKGNSYVVCLAGKSLQFHFDINEFNPKLDHPVVKYLKLQAPLCNDGEFYLLSMNSRKTRANNRMATIVYANKDKKLLSAMVFPKQWSAATAKLIPGTFNKIQTGLTDDGARFVTTI